LDSAAVLKAIEAQHGILVERAKRIYSFSRLPFQEYFTAKYVVENESKGAIERLLAQHLLTGSSDDARWCEVFLLTANMFDDADDFLNRMANRINDFGKEKLNRAEAPTWFLNHLLRRNPLDQNSNFNGPKLYCRGNL
jgi:predicted NACHT family NTPase